MRELCLHELNQVFGGASAEDYFPPFEVGVVMGLAALGVPYIPAVSAMFAGGVGAYVVWNLLQGSISNFRVLAYITGGVAFTCGAIGSVLGIKLDARVKNWWYGGAKAKVE